MGPDQQPASPAFHRVDSVGEQVSDNLPDLACQANDVLGGPFPCPDLNVEVVKRGL